MLETMGSLDGSLDTPNPSNSNPQSILTSKHIVTISGVIFGAGVVAGRY